MLNFTYLVVRRGGACEDQCDQLHTWCSQRRLRPANVGISATSAISLNTTRGLPTGALKHELYIYVAINVCYDKPDTCLFYI